MDNREPGNFDLQQAMLVLATLRLFIRYCGESPLGNCVIQQNNPAHDCIYCGRGEYD